MNIEELRKKTIPVLKTLLRERHIYFPSKSVKADLINLLLKKEEKKETTVAKIKKEITTKEKKGENSGFTGVRDIDVLIFQQLSDKDLGHMCQLNTEMYALCKDENFWKQRGIQMYGPEFILENIHGIEWSRFYKEYHVATVYRSSTIKEHLKRWTGDSREKVNKQHEASFKKIGYLSFGHVYYFTEKKNLRHMRDGDIVYVNDALYLTAKDVGDYFTFLGERHGTSYKLIETMRIAPSHYVPFTAQPYMTYYEAIVNATKYYDEDTIDTIAYIQLHRDALDYLFRYGVPYFSEFMQFLSKKYKEDKIDKIVLLFDTPYVWLTNEYGGQTRSKLFVLSGDKKYEFLSVIGNPYT